MRSITHYVNGRPLASASGRSGPVSDPATGEQTGVVDFVSGAGVDAAIKTATNAAKGWRASSLAARAEILFSFRELLAARREEVARLVTAEHGKVLSDAAGEVARGIENVEFACGIPQLLKGGYSEQASRGVDVYSVLQPLGVVAGISPFNFPAMVPLWMCANAIGCGNCFVLKPGEKDPSPSLLIAGLCREAGLPDGVFTVLQGDREAVERILDHPDIAAVSFVGSTPVARHLYETSTRNGKRVEALAGAKNHMVVLPDADLDMAPDGPVSAGYGSARERWMAVSVLMAVGHVGDQLVEAIAERTQQVKVGPGDDPSSQMGPLATAEHRQRVASYLSDPALGGARVVVDGRESSPTGGGFFLGPSLADGVQPGTRVYDDEIFGPVLSVVRVDGHDEAVALVNSNRWANGVAVFTRDGGAARSFQFDIEAGMVGINVPIPVPASDYSFWGLERVAVRRPAHVRTRGHQVLQPDQSGDLTLAPPAH